VNAPATWGALTVDGLSAWMPGPRQVDGRLIGHGTGPLSRVTSAERSDRG
jgi:hypothetical protein